MAPRIASPQITRVARLAKRGNSGLVLPTDNAFQLHWGALTDVNAFEGMATFDWGDENADPTALPILLPYATAADAAVGHNVIVAQFGTTAFVLGQNLNYTNVVTLS
jgi:hypothetical protein